LGESSPTVEAAVLDEVVAEAADDKAIPAEVAPSIAVDTSLAARRKKITADAKPKDADDLGRVRVPEPVSRTAAPSARESRAEARAAVTEQTRVESTRVKDAEDNDADVRFAQVGHHPSETSTGLLGRLRRQPKLPDNHIHKFKESGSSVGLVRRVCIECAYVSIGSDDD
jgi:hypothetical protein